MGYLVRCRRKAGPTARRRAKKRRVVSAEERHEKELVRTRDKRRRFPRCGCLTNRLCDAMKRVPTVSHDFHKGMGGDPNGRVSIAALMILFCKWRHQDGRVSRHAGTLRTQYLTPDNNDGPVAFEVDLAALYPGRYAHSAVVWFEVGRELEPGTIGPTNEEQDQVLADLAEMVR